MLNPRTADELDAIAQVAVDAVNKRPPRLGLLHRYWPDPNLLRDCE
jgi:hypothetical protein